MSYIIAPLDKVKEKFPEFLDVMKQLETATINRAKEVWPGYTLGGLIPTAKEFGLGTILPKNIRGKGTYTWVQTFTAPGSWTNIFSYTVKDDLIHSFAGFAIPDPELIFSQFRIEHTDKKYPIIDIEEARTFKGGVAIIIKADVGEEIVVPEKKSFLLKGYQERGTSGLSQRVIPLGLCAYIDVANYVTE